MLNSSGSKREGACELCARHKPLEFHHLIPRKTHKKVWFKKQFGKEEMQTRGLYVCRQCHRHIHRHIDEKTLGRYYNTRDKLLSHPEIAKFVAWVARQR